MKRIAEAHIRQHLNFHGIHLQWSIRQRWQIFLMNATDPVTEKRH